MSDEQRRPRSDAALCGDWSGLHALRSTTQCINGRTNIAATEWKKKKKQKKTKKKKQQQQKKKNKTKKNNICFITETGFHWQPVVRYK